MKTFQFKQHNTTKAIVVAVIYFLIVFTVAYFWLGGINSMADKVNSIGNAKGTGLIVGIIVLAPFFILLRLLQPNLTVDLDARKITIRQKGQQDLMIHFNAISRMELHTKRINRLDIYDKQNNLLSYLHPTSNPEVLEHVIREIVAATGFGTLKKPIKMMGKNIETIIYRNNVS